MLSTDAFFDELTKIGALSDSVVRKAISSAPAGRVEAALAKNRTAFGSLARQGKISPNREKYNTMLEQGKWLQALKPAAKPATTMASSAPNKSRGFLRSQLTLSDGIGA
jgi:hypothetical protein